MESWYDGGTVLCNPSSHDRRYWIEVIKRNNVIN